LSPQTLSRELPAMGYHKLPARPRHHVQAEGAIEDFKKLPARRDEIARHEGLDADSKMRHDRLFKALLQNSRGNEHGGSVFQRGGVFRETEITYGAPHIVPIGMLSQAST
jgi:hypothetical protein